MKSALIVFPLKRYLDDGVNRMRADLGAEYFSQAGFALPSIPCERVRQRSSALLDLLGKGGKVIAVRPDVLKAVPCTVAEVGYGGGRDTFYLDPSRGYALLRHEKRTVSGKLALSCDNSNFAKLHNIDVWLPRRCEEEHYTWPTIPDQICDEPLIGVTYVVSEVSGDHVSEDRFALRYVEPGTVVSDGTLPGAESHPRGRITYTVPANPKDLDRVIEAAVAGKPFVPSMRWSAVRLAFVGANVVAVVFVAFWIWQRRKRTTRTVSRTR